ncbi:putative harbinger transposase-derived nuclease [Abeliophyllum distichum]|uniref:Harbinger transposase-derived nuclease n=1 Tax=Abeliophyllum distichum TaxID=126358 RepID=A0ABD1S9P1_9LAMI
MDEELDIHCVIESDSDDGSKSSSDSSDEERLANLEHNTLTWLRYCRMAGNLVRQYIESSRVRIRRFPNVRNGHVFMISALEEDPNIAFCEFRMYPPMFVHFTHMLRDDYDLQSRPDVDIYEQVGMFLFILAHDKGYRQVRTVFDHSLQTIHHYFGVVLRAVVKLGAKIIKPKTNYNESPPDHRPSSTRHLYFQDCIGAIDGTHVKAVLSASERLHFIGRKGYPSQNVLAACDFNMCFTFVLPGTTGNVHDSRILARAIHSTDINFPQPANGKYYLVDSGFAHRPGYMAPYKGPDIRYHFQEFPPARNGGRRQFRNPQERFNFNHSSLRNVIERAFGVLKNMWNILDRMPNYSFRKQTAVMLVTMAIHNFLRRAGQVDRAFETVEEVVDAAEIDLPDEKEEIAATNFAPHVRNIEWDQFRDDIAHKQTQQASSSGVAVNEDDVVLKVLGERRGHRRAVGLVLRGTSRSHSFTTTLRDQTSTSQSTQATNTLKSKIETFIHQMNEFITLLTSNLQSVMSGIQLPTPPPPPPLSHMHEEELDSSNDEDYLSDL